jgi:response regulator RpfG family c-di-GMP phosphodiesterase
MDIQMPVMNGFDAAKEIHQHNSALSKLPIIALTANVMKGFEEECLKAGMNDYLCKPFDPDTLYEKIQLHLSLHLTQPADASAPRNLSSSGNNLNIIASSKNTTDSVTNELPGINIELGMKRWPNDTSEYFVHLLTFIDEIKNSAVDIDEFIASSQFEKLKRFIHKISGSASFLALNNLSEAAANIEKAVHYLIEDSINNVSSDASKVTSLMLKQYRHAVSEILDHKKHIVRIRDLANK